MTFLTSRYPLLIGLIVSLIIHLISLTLAPPIIPAPPKEIKPLLVELKPSQPRRETVIPRQPQKPAETVDRQGVNEQQVVKEQAPKGLDQEDSSPVIARPTPPQPKKTPPQPQRPAKKTPQTVTVHPGQITAAEPSEALPSLQRLLESGNNAAADITRSAQTKQRPDIESGDELLLNMTQDKLFSFFARFKKSIYAVWNYPDESIKRRQQGIALLKIVINRDGSVEDVDLISASGHERLDREAIAAIFKAQPYGRLPQNYPDDQLTIMAYFEYVLGQSTPNIYRRE
ncbi:MAG: energy transducer TonB [Desulfuromonas sp.]|nr:energy transducer TonB [Desulfuromonas sp.]